LKPSKATAETMNDDEAVQSENPDGDPEFISGEEDYMDSDFEGREGYRKGSSYCQSPML
jgi:hypothetical protein